MHSLPHISLRDSIATRLLVMVFSVYFLVTLTVTVLHMAAEYNNSKQEIEQNFNTYFRMVEKGISQTMWNMDFETVRNLARGIEQIPDVIGISILDFEGRALARTGIILNEKGEIIIGENTPQDEVPKKNNLLNEIFSKTYPVHFINEGQDFVVGKVTLYSSTAVVFNKVRFGFLFILINSVIKTIALWLIFLWFSRSMLSRPLAELTRAAKQVKLDNLENSKIIIHTVGRNELKILEESFNYMIENLKMGKEAILRSVMLEKEIQSAGERLNQLEAEYKQMTNDLNEAKNQLTQAEKLSTLGQMVAGVAHEIANPVNFLGGFIHVQQQKVSQMKDFLHDLIGDNPEAKEVLQELDNRFIEIQNNHRDMNIGIQRIREINQALRNYSRTDLSMQPNINVTDIIQDTLVILRAKISRHELKTHFEELPLVRCFRSHLGQIFTNLIANASDALDEKVKSLEAEQVEFKGAIEILVKPAVSELENGILICVEDNGPGVPPALREKIFQAFFTTKPVGVGTGLGLAVCLNIVKEHRGILQVLESKMGGASFQLWLPIDPQLKPAAAH